MNGNYEWQKHQANERVQARLHEAAEHRRAKLGNSEAQDSFSMKIMFPVLVGIIVIILLMSGWTPGVGAIGNSEPPAKEAAGLTMAERIHFQDERDVNYRNKVTDGISDPPANIHPADRKFFTNGYAASNP